ncbi:cysteine desulfurase family protein [Aggregatilineales bacterium SYSU G02658]
MKRSVYLDYAATTPMDPRVVEAMMPYFTQIYGNSHSAHRFGSRAEHAVETAREQIARVFNCKPTEVYFTSGGSESNNLAIRGAAWAASPSGKRHIVTTPVEHSAVLNTAKQLAKHQGFSLTVLPVDHQAQVDVEEFAGALQPETAIASVMYANNEVGTIQPLPLLSKHARERGVLFHTDAVQAAGQLQLDVQLLGVDMLSISGHKFYGPKGVGALYVREGTLIMPAQTGGSHERGLRAGTLNTPAIVGMATALTLAYEEYAMRHAAYIARRDQLIDGVLSRVSGAHLSGDSTQRLPSHASFIFDGIDGNQLVMHLDIRGVAVSSASACKTGNPEPSSVLMAMGYEREQALGSLRVTVGLHTTEEDIDYAVESICQAVEALRALKAAL